MSASASPKSLVSGVAISHPDRVIERELGLRKLDVARYYAAVSERMLPHVAGRPLTLVHCPEELSGPCRYLRHGKAWGPKSLRRVQIQEKTKVGEYLVADDVPSLIGLAQMGVLEVHTWNSTTDDVERPNRIVWDLDPGPDVEWAAVVRAARSVRRVVEVLGLASWVKTTGGRGLHVVAPVVPQRDWSECLAFTRAVAEALVRSDPALYTTAFAKRGRDARILIDYLRNNRTNTSVAAFSTRARPGIPVSVPIAWDELTPRLRPARWTVRTVVRRQADPWADYWTTRQRITRGSLEAATRL